MADFEDVMRRIHTENQQHREEQGKLTSRAVSAIGSGNYADINAILDEITGVQRTGEDDGVEPMEAGDVDRVAGAESTAITPETK